MSNLIAHYVDQHAVGTQTQLNRLLTKGALHPLDYIAGTLGEEAVIAWLAKAWEVTPAIVKGYVMITKNPFFILEEHHWVQMAEYGWALRPTPDDWRVSNQARLLFEIIGDTNETTDDS